MARQEWYFIDAFKKAYEAEYNGFALFKRPFRAMKKGPDYWMRSELDFNRMKSSQMIEDYAKSNPDSLSAKVFEAMNKP